MLGPKSFIQLARFAQEIDNVTARARQAISEAMLSMIALFIHRQSTRRENHLSCTSLCYPELAGRCVLGLKKKLLSSHPDHNGIQAGSFATLI